MKAAEALELPLHALGKALRRREVTAVALAEEALSRLSTRGRALNAVAALTEGRAHAEARAADAELARGHDRGPLHGIPYGVKDLCAARGAPTTWGAPMYRGRVLDEDATVVERLSAAGAVLVGKLSTVQLAGGFGYVYADASLQGPGKNPWDPGRWAGGSSSGPATAVAARCVPFAIGSETWGSILNPATLCGVTGVRPSFGRVPRGGVMALAWSMDKVGVLATSAEDAGLVLAVIAGPDAKDAASLVPAPPLTPPSAPRRLKVAAVLPQALVHQSEEMFAAHEATLEALAQVAEVERFAWELGGPPSHGIPAEAVATITLAAEEAAAFEDLVEEGHLSALTGTNAPAQARVDQSIRAVDYLRAQRLRARLREGYRELFTRYDAICTPSLGFNLVPPPKLTEDLIAAYPGEDPFGAAGNLLGLPAVALPGPLVHGLPTGMQLLGAWGEEGRVLEGARALQARTRWHRARPPGT